MSRGAKNISHAHAFATSLGFDYLPHYRLDDSFIPIIPHWAIPSLDTASAWSSPPSFSRPAPFIARSNDDDGPRRRFRADNTGLLLSRIDSHLSPTSRRGAGDFEMITSRLRLHFDFRRCRDILSVRQHRRRLYRRDALATARRFFHGHRV